MTGERTKGFFAKEPRKQVPLVFVFSSGFRFMSSLSVRQRILIGFTLFAMFFGAGNLIFPPWLGAEAATSSFTGFLGFLTTAVGFPILGVMAVAESGGLKPLASRVGPRFAVLFTLLIYLSIGPCLAIPRTAGTSFEMIGRPLAEATGILSTTYFGFEVLTLLQAAYSVLFFAAAFWVALDPDKLTARLGKFLCPTLLFLIAILWVGCLFNPAESASAPVGRYADNAFFAGFIDGYQTMDTLAALNFGLIIAMNIRAFGITADRAVVKETVLAGAMAAGLFFFVYGALVMLGTSAAALGTFENGAQLLSAAAGTFFGSAGTVVIGLVFFIACFVFQYLRGTHCLLLGLLSQHLPRAFLPRLGLPFCRRQHGAQQRGADAHFEILDSGIDRHLPRGTRTHRAGVCVARSSGTHVDRPLSVDHRRDGTRFRPHGH